MAPVSGSQARRPSHDLLHNLQCFSAKLLSCGLKAGPLYYGFSELTTQQAVAALYNETELQAAMQVPFPLARCCSCLLVYIFATSHTSHTTPYVAPTVILIHNKGG